MALLARPIGIGEFRRHDIADDAALIEDPALLIESQPLPYCDDFMLFGTIPAIGRKPRFVNAAARCFPWTGMPWRSRHWEAGRA